LLVCCARTILTPAIATTIREILAGPLDWDYLLWEAEENSISPLLDRHLSAVALGAGAVLMQFMVQGAWGVVPAYLTELSPAPVRATAPGLAYQLGGLITSWNGKGQALAAERWGGYRAVLSITVVVVALSLAALAAMGHEAKGREMSDA
jgi:SHS family lactate transporter-like MFS transporter